MADTSSDADGVTVTESEFYAEVGNTGLKQFSGWLYEEFNPRLRGRLEALTYRDMTDSDPTVGAILFAITQTVRGLDWRWEPADASKQAAAAAEFCEGMAADMAHTWADFMAEALTMLSYGYAPMEIVLKRRGGDTASPPSKFADGAIGLHKIALRGQDTILNWSFDDETGEILSVTQQPWTGTIVTIPIEKLLLLRTTKIKNNPQGRSLLRNAWKPWFFLKRIEEIEAIGIERELAGLPVARVPSKLIDAAKGTGVAADQARAAYASYQQMVVNLRRNEQAGALLPSDRDDKGNLLYDLTLLTTGGTRQVDTDKVITRKQREIAASVLADFILLGHESRGTQALAVSKVDIFLGACQGYLDTIAESFNAQVLPLIWKLNGWPYATMPKLTAPKTRRLDLDQIGNFVANLARAGVNFAGNPEALAILSEMIGLPAPEDPESVPQ